MTNFIDQSHYVVMIVGADGHVVAQATAAPGDQDAVPFPGSAAGGTPAGMTHPSTRFVSSGHALPNAGVCCDALLPTVSTSNSRVYYPDGPTALRFLAPDGSSGSVISLPNVAGRARAVFAVSPDDRRIAVSLFDWSTRPMTMRIYVADLDGAHQVDLFSSTSLYEWPVGWHNGDLVLAGGPALGAAPNPYAASWYHLVDATSGTRLAVLGGSGCPAVGPLTPAGTVCINSRCHCIQAVDWSGSARPTYTYNDVSELNWAALSPDGQAVIFSEIYGARTGGGIWRSGAITWLPGYEENGTESRWLDGVHTIINPCGSSGGMCVGIQDLTTGSTARVATDGQIAGILPGGL